MSFPVWALSKCCAPENGAQLEYVAPTAVQRDVIPSVLPSLRSSCFAAALRQAASCSGTEWEVVRQRFASQ